MKLSPNTLCPCGSGVKYKKCCSKYHKGTFTPNALILMKSRYTAYTTGNADYLIKTTHPNNNDYTEDKKSWKHSILEFTKDTEFLNLKIIEFIDGETEAYVTFIAKLSSKELREKSRFLKEDGKWLYVDGVFDL
jgi:SEC-C motif-containing protein